MTSQLTAVWWSRHKPKPKQMPPSDWPNTLASIEKLAMRGLLLSLLIGLLVLLSGCASPPIVVSAKCPPYPLPPDSLLAPPLNRDLGEMWLSPSRNAKPD